MENMKKIACYYNHDGDYVTMLYDTEKKVIIFINYTKIEVKIYTLDVNLIEQIIYELKKVDTYTLISYDFDIDFLKWFVNEMKQLKDLSNREKMLLEVLIKYTGVETK